MKKELRPDIPLDVLAVGNDDEVACLLLWPTADVGELEDLECPESIPWSLLSGYEFYKSLAKQRGGLTPRELVAVLSQKSWFAVEHMTNAVVVAAIRVALKAASIRNVV